MRLKAGLFAAVALGACQTQAPAVDMAETGVVSSGSQEDLAMFDPPAGPLGEADVWRVDLGDVVTHILSGATCPATRGDLRRDKQIIYRANGMDVGCNYIGADGTVLRFYVFTSELGGLDAEMKSTADSMRAQQPIAKEEPFGSPSPEFRSYTLAYTGPSGTPMRSSLLLAQVNGGWMVKVRVTGPEAGARKTEELAARVLMEEANRLKSRPVPRMVRATTY